MDSKNVCSLQGLSTKDEFEIAYEFVSRCASTISCGCSLADVPSTYLLEVRLQCLLLSRLISERY